MAVCQLGRQESVELPSVIWVAVIGAWAIGIGVIVAFIRGATENEARRREAMRRRIEARR